MEPDVFGLIHLNNTKALHLYLQQVPSHKDQIGPVRLEPDGEIIGEGTPLHYATLNNRVICVMVLLKAGADPDIKFTASDSSSIYSEKTTTELAKLQKLDDILMLLTSPAEHRNAGDEIYNLKQQVSDLQAKYDSLTKKMEEKDVAIRELQRFVKGEQKRKGYARS